MPKFSPQRKFFFRHLYKNSIDRLFRVVTLHRQEETGRRGGRPLNPKPRTLTFWYKPAAQSVRQMGSNAQCRLGATHRERRDTGISPEGTRTPVVLGDSPRRQGCLVTRIEPSSASTPRAQNIQQPHAKGVRSMRLFLYMPKVTSHDEIQNDKRSEETEVFYIIENQLLIILISPMTFCFSPSKLTHSQL